MSIKRRIVIGADVKQAEDGSDTKVSKKKKKTKVSDEPTVIQGKVGSKSRLVMAPMGKIAGPKAPRVFAEDGKVLIIVESPAKSNTIEKFLGPNFTVKASMGHLRDLPKSQLGVDVSHNFEPQYINLQGRKKTIDELSAIADKSSAVYLATDPDREGEAISWHLAHILNLNEKETNRITFNEITNHAVNEALKNPRTIDMDMVDAQQARRILDRLVGYKLSPLLWKKVCKGLSAGRVQSVAVRLICEREREIQAFIPDEYWTIEGVYEGIEEGKKKTFTAELTHVDGEKASIVNENSANAIIDTIRNFDAEVSAVEKRKRTRKPAPPFTTSTLQQEGVRKLNFGAKRTMMIAQHLYEGKEIGGMGHVGLITYMRTDSTRIAEEMQIAAKEYIEKNYGEAYYPSKPNQYGAKESAQDAHEGIRPTSLALSPKMVAPSLNKDELRLYTLIWNRFMASQMASQTSESLSITLEVKNCRLRASGSKVLFKGFTEVYDEKKDEDDKMLPLLHKGDIVQNKDIKGLQHFTQPPARYSEAGLIKILEEKGIGRPSTYAPIMDTIQARNYVQKAEKQFVPTELGFVVVDFLVAHFDSIINVDFTAHLETELDAIAEGKDTYPDVLGKFYTAFNEEMTEADSAEKVKVADEVSDEVCEKCGSPMVYKFGRFGRFLGCSNFPECNFTKAINTGTGITCPKCHEGEIIERKSKRGRLFYGCSAYPKCDFVLWNKPIDEFCSVCGSIMVEKSYKNGTTKKFCSNEECSTREPKKKRMRAIKNEDMTESTIPQNTVETDVVDKTVNEE